MFLRKRAQSTAEYAIVLALVAALAAGILQVALKGGIRQKQTKAVDYLLGAGKDEPAFQNATAQNVSLFSQEYRETTVSGGEDFIDESVMQKGGLEKRRQKQVTETTAVSIETINATQ